MRRALCIVLLTTGLLLIPSPAPAQESQPSGGDELSKAKAELRELQRKFNDLQAYVDELEKKLAERPKDRSTQPRVAPRVNPPTTQRWQVVPPRTFPLPPATPQWPYRFEVPSPDPYHFRDPEYRFELPRPARPGPATRPAPFPGYPVPRDQAPNDWGRREFNGQPYYVIPLR